MDVQLPDGTILRGVPDGTTKAQIAEKLRANGRAVPSEWMAPSSASKTGGEQPQDAGAMAPLSAIATGFNRGLVRLAGLPVDTAANIRDLAKAAAGAPFLMAGKTPPEFLQIGDRANDVGSGENLLRAARATEAGRRVLDGLPDQSYEGGYLQAVGGGLAGAVTPGQAAMGAAGSIAGKAAYDLTGDESAAIAASMLPMAARKGLTAGVKRVVRGGEEGRVQMAQRVADLRAAGVDEPTLGLASGNKTIGGIENLLQNTPGAVGVMQRARDKAIAGMEASAERAADLASTDRGALEAGRRIQSGGKAARDAFKEQQNALYARLDKYIDPQQAVDVGGTKKTLAALNEDIKGAPELSRQFKNARIMAIEDAINSDTSGAPKSVQVFARPAVGGGGIMNAPVEQLPILVDIPAGPPRNTLPFEAVKKTRTLVGSEIADNSIMSDVPRSKWTPLYAALSDDIKGAADAAGPQARNAFERASNYTRAGIGRLERIAPVVDRPAPEQSFTALQNTLKENLSTFQAVKKSLPEDARGSFAGTIIERLGKATPGQQDATGGKWSPETFLTNWNKIKPEAQAELLAGIPNAAEVKGLVDSVAEAASLMRSNSKQWANPSGTSANATARGVIGTTAAGGAGAAAGLMSPAVPLAAAAGLTGINLTARALTSNQIRNAMLKRTETSPQELNALVRAMAASGRLGQQEKQ